MTCSSSELDVFELEDDVPGGWYLHRFGVGKRMVICLQPASYIGQNICKSSLVSLTHAVIELREDRSWFIKDLDSKHGTYVNDKIVPEKGLVLEEWDVICFGRKRPRNANEFGFMLKYKEASQSEKSTTAKTTSCSGESVSTLGKNDVDELSVSENREHNLGKPEKLQEINNDGSPIEFSDDSWEGDNSRNNSEKTVKLTEGMIFEVGKVSYNHPVLQQKTVSIEEKIGNWLMTKEEQPVIGRRKRRRRKKLAESDYALSNDSLSGSTSSSKIKSKRYETRPKHKDSFNQRGNASPLESGSRISEDNDATISERSDFSQSTSKRLKHNSKHMHKHRYYEDETWKPYKPKPQKRKEI